MSSGLTRRRQAYGFGPPALPAPPQAASQLTLTLREYVDLRFYELEKRMEQSGTLYLAANAERQASMEKRLEGMNEFRGQLNTQAAAFATRENVDQRIAAVETLTRTLSDANEHRIGSLEQFQANMQGRMTMVSAGGFILSVLVAIVLHFWH